VSWSARIDEPIPLPRGRQLVTLQDAGKYITKLPKAVHDAPEWQVAMEALILVATHGGPTMFARIGVMQALNRHHIREFNTNRKPHHWGGKAQAEEGSMKDAFDLWWEWVTKTPESMLMIDGDIHYAITELSPEDRRDREKVNEAVRRYRESQKRST
jgi:hypothetical protein